MSDPIPQEIHQHNDGTSHQPIPCLQEPPGRSTPSTNANVVYDQWVNQLAPLASQHHMSEYSRIKYGHQGCPVTYAPLSLHLPDVVRELRERQQKYVDQALWWPCSASADQATSPIIPAEKQRAALNTGDTMPHPGLQQELTDALSESIPIQLQPRLPLNLSHQRATRSPPSHVKTSESHPINISTMIPPESLVAISSHLTPCKKPFPVLFDIQLPYSLDRITGYAQLLPSFLDSSKIPLPPHSLPTVLPSISSRKYLAPNELRSSVTDALHAALNTKISLPPLPIPTSKLLVSLKRNSKPRTTAAEPSEGDIFDTIPKISTPRVASPHTQPSHRPSEGLFKSVLDLPATVAFTRPLPHTHPPTNSTPPKKLFRHRISTSSRCVTPPRHLSASQRPFRLGNLHLSSCPGKKVRLTGPVRGRGAVCRDLDIDLRRMKNLGVRCIVCCLGDEELEFLIGISWTEYCQVAHREGLDVLRIPLPEGLAPLSPKSLDTDLHRIIERYTLQGASVLVHCRGGVGRAGLFACCWMLKLGLCGWIETDVQLDATTSTDEIKSDVVSSESFKWNGNTVVHRDTLQLVERVIGVVRRRRSVKAVETMEQVQFLVEYVDYLRRSGRLAGELSSLEKR